MRQVQARVLSNKQLWGEFLRHGGRKFSATMLIWLECPEVAAEAKAGQFVMVQCGGGECTLPRPFSVHRVDNDGIALFYAVLEGGKGTTWLSRREAGDRLNLFGPLGKGFSIQPGSRNLLLVAGGNGIAPLFLLAHQAKGKNCPVTLLYGTADSRRLPVPPAIETVAATEDGSAGYRGKVTELLPEYIDRADQVFACGPAPMYRAMAQMQELRNKPVQVSLEARMGCGLGACYGCAVKTKGGLRQACKDGPVFELGDVCWDEFVPA